MSTVPRLLAQCSAALLVLASMLVQSLFGAAQAQPALQAVAVPPAPSLATAVARTEHTDKKLFCIGCVSVADQDGDGKPDLLLTDGGYRKEPESSSSIRIARSGSGYALSSEPFQWGVGGARRVAGVCAMGDLDQDGIEDLALVELPSDSNGQAAIVFLSIRSLHELGRVDLPQAGMSASARLPCSLDGQCDIDGDGTRDVVLGLPSARPADSSSAFGVVLVVSGRSRSLLRSQGCPFEPMHVESAASTRLVPVAWARSIATLGDLDGDGCAEYCVSGIDRSWRPSGVHGLVCFSGKSGSVLWKYSTAPELQYAAGSLATLIPAGAPGGPLLAACDGLKSGELLDAMAGQVLVRLRDPSPYVGQEGYFGTSLAVCRRHQGSADSWLAVGCEDMLALDMAGAYVFDTKGKLLWMLDTREEQTIVFAIHDIDGDGIDDLAISLLGHCVRIVGSRAWTRERAAAAAEPADFLFEIGPPR